MLTENETNELAKFNNFISPNLTSASQPRRGARKDAIILDIDS